MAYAHVLRQFFFSFSVSYLSSSFATYLQIKKVVVKFLLNTKAYCWLEFSCDRPFIVVDLNY